MTDSLYHERQRLGHCAVHALNNLFQEQWVDYSEMLRLAEELHHSDAPACLPLAINPYKSVVPCMGYFDISVIIKALQWKNKGKFSRHITMASDIDALKLPCRTVDCSNEMELHPRKGFVGFIVNVLEESMLGFVSGRHWYSIILQESGAMEGTDTDTLISKTTDVKYPSGYSYWNMDSKLHEPHKFASDEDLKLFLKHLIENQQAHIFVISAESSHSTSPSEAIAR